MKADEIPGLLMDEARAGFLYLLRIKTVEDLLSNKGKYVEPYLDTIRQFQEDYPENNFERDLEKRVQQDVEGSRDAAFGFGCLAIKDYILNGKNEKIIQRHVNIMKDKLGLDISLQQINDARLQQFPKSHQYAEYIKRLHKAVHHKNLRKTGTPESYQRLFHAATTKYICYLEEVRKSKDHTQEERMKVYSLLHEIKNTCIPKFETNIGIGLSGDMYQQTFTN